MSDEDDAMAALEGFVPIGRDHPAVVAMAESLAAVLAERELAKEAEEVAS